MSMTSEETPLGFFCRASLECWDEASFAQWATVITHPKKSIGVSVAGKFSHALQAQSSKYQS